MDTTLTNIFPLPFVAGPASCTSAVFTALDVAHKINVVTATNSLNIPDGTEHECTPEEIDRARNEDENNSMENPGLTRSLDPPAWKTIIVLDLDLYSKVG